MPNELSAETRETPFFTRLGLWILLAAAFTSIIVQYSLRNGRLTDWPTFDDVGYIADAADRMNHLWLEGTGTFRHNYVVSPPHSPFETLFGMTAFLIFGMHDWAPYAMNGALVVAYLAFADYLLRKLPVWQRLLGFVFLLATRLLMYSVNEFRPDHAGALATIAACILILEKPLLTASIRRLVLIGSLIGLSLLIKPPTFVATLMLTGATLVLGVGADWFSNRTRPTFLNLLYSWGIILGVAVVIALPHFLVNWREIVTYIYDNMYGKYKDIWKTKGDFWFQFWYYVRGPHRKGGPAFNSMLGCHAPMLLVILAIGAAVNFIGRQRPPAGRTAAMTLLLLGTFVMGVMNPVKSLFLGLPFQTCLLFLGLMTLGDWMARMSPRWCGSIIAGVAALVSVYLVQWPDRYGDYNGPQQTSLRSVNSGIFDTIVQHQGPGHARVFIMGIGTANPAVLRYRSIQQQRDIEFYGIEDAATIPQYAAEWDKCDFVVASQKDTLITAQFLLSHKLLDDLLAKLRERPDFKEIGFYPFIYSGRGYYVFQKIRK